MAESFFGNVLELLVGLLVLPRVVTFLWILLVAYFGLGAQEAVIANLVFSAVLIILTFFMRRMVAVGFLIGSIWDVIAGYLVLFG